MAISLDACRCDAKTKVLIIAILYTASSAISTLSSIIYLSVKTTDSEENTSNHYLAANLSSSIIGTIVSILLTYGIIKDKRLFLLPWITLIALGHGVLTLIIVILTFIEPLLLLLWILMAFLWYTWYTVWIYYRSLDPHNPEYVPQTLM